MASSLLASYCTDSHPQEPGPLAPGRADIRSPQSIELCRLRQGSRDRRGERATACWTAGGPLGGRQGLQERALADGKWAMA